MLLDTHKMKAIDARNNQDWAPSDYDYDLDVFVYRVIWVSDGQSEEGGQMMTYMEAAEFLARPDEGEDELKLADALEILSRGHRVWCGPEDNLYLIKPLPAPMVVDGNGESVPLDGALN